MATSVSAMIKKLTAATRLWRHHAHIYGFKEYVLHRKLIFYTIFQEVILLKKVQELERDVGHKKGRCGSFLSCITVYDDIPAKDVQKRLTTKPEDYQRIVVFLMDKDNVELIKIIGDGHSIDVTCMGIAGAMLLYCITFYIYEIPYPSKHNQILGLIQHTVLKESYAWKKSKRFTELISDIAPPSQSKNSQGTKRKIEGKILKEKSQNMSDDDKGAYSDDSDNSDINVESMEQHESSDAKSKRKRIPKIHVDV